MKFRFVQPEDEKMASFRYRVKPAREYLQSKGWEWVKHWNDADLIVFGKHYNPPADWALLKECKRWGIITVFDICDWHFDNDKLAAHYSRMASGVDGLIVPNETWLQQPLPQKPEIVGDGYEFDEKEPKCEAHSPLRVLWYGHSTNFHLLDKIKPARDSVLQIITNQGPPPPVVWTPYSKEAMQEGLEWCDLVIVPADSPLKSPNRMIEAIRSGRFVVASDLPQHRVAGTCLGDINAGIEWYRNNLGEALERLKQAQAVVREQYSPEKIGEQWLTTLTKIHERATLKAAA